MDINVFWTRIVNRDGDRRAKRMARLTESRSNVYNTPASRLYVNADEIERDS